MISRIFLCLFSFVAVVGMSLATVAAGDLKQARDAQNLAVQKIKGQVEDAINRSGKQDPVDAKFTLRGMLDRVKNSSDLTEAERTPLVQRLQARLNAVQETARGKQVTQDQTPSRDPPRYYKPPTYDPGKGVSSAAKDFISGAKSAQQANADLIRQREKGVRETNKDPVYLAGDKDIGFPADWKEKMRIRKESVSQKLTPEEVKLLKTLNSTLTVKYKDDKLSAVIGDLMDRTRLTIVVDPASLQDLNIDYEADTVTIELPKVGVRTALKTILGQKGLTYIIKEGNIMVMSPKRASEYTVVRSYPIDDLVTIDPRMQLFNPFFAEAKKMQNAQMLMNLIQSTIEPGYWAPNGPGTMAFYPGTSTLIIRASAEMHYQLGSPGMFGGR